MSRLAQEPFLRQEAEEAGTWMSLNLAIACMDHGVGKLLGALIQEGEVPEQRVHIVIRRERLTAVVTFDSGQSLRVALRADMLAADPLAMLAIPNLRRAGAP